jgi:chemotaxis protein histidine kinase CheA
MSNHELDFDAEELATLRQLFRTEAQDALEAVTTRLLAAGSAKPSPDALTEMMRVTHTLKGAAGTVGLDAMVDLSHRLESALAALGRDAPSWGPATADQLVEITDALRGYLDRVEEPDADALADRIRDQIDQVARPDRRPESQPPPFVEPPPEPVLEPAPDGGPAPEPKSWLRVEPERIDNLMSSAGELRSIARGSSAASSSYARSPATSRDPADAARLARRDRRSEQRDAGRDRGRARGSGGPALPDDRGAARRDRGAAAHDRRAPARAHAHPHGERGQPDAARGAHLAGAAPCDGRACGAAHARRGYRVR